MQGMMMQGRMQGMMQGPGGQPGDVQAPPKPKVDNHVKITLENKLTVSLTIELLEGKANRELIDAIVQPMVVRQKGDLDMSGGQLRLFDVGDAVRRMVEAKGQFPPGAFPRPIPSSRLGRPYAPNERVSWLAELLPFFDADQRALYGRINRDKSWRDSDNLGTASTLIPQFVVPNYPDATRWAAYPNVRGQLAATHYVGIAGIGLDAAEYSASDPAVAGKLGIFGYDRSTNVKEIKDGLANTILMAQVPPEFNRPWLAGGGATVQGVPESGSVRPFVSPQADGKRGTMVVMADGSVRFVSENVSDEVFKALCTINGGERIILNRDAPAVAAPEGKAEMKAVEPSSPPPAAAAPKAAPLAPVTAPKAAPAKPTTPPAKSS
jgi:hypothetical protein